MKILIIGSKGFIGKHCVDHFSRSGIHFVTQADISASQGSENYIQLEPKNTDFSKLFENNRFDICINASGSPGVGFSIEHTSEDFILNTINVFNILNCIKKLNPDCRFINFSSAAVYGNPKNLPIKESDETKPLSPYGFHKLQSEQTLREFYDWHQIKTISLRIFSAYGPGIKKQLFWDLYQKSKGNNAIEIFGTGNESRDFIYIDDLIRAIELIIQKAEFNGQVINIASGKETTIKDAVNYFVQKYDSNIRISFNGKIKKGDPLNWKADISLLKNLGFSTLKSIEDGIEEYVKWTRGLQTVK
jgi:UDP-glucose 4-epimerase